MQRALKFSPEALAKEAETVSRKLAAAPRSFAKAGNIDYGATEKHEVYRDGKIVLYRYRGAKAPTAKVPLLISYALVNRPYMVDLQTDRSIVRGLLERGLDVYIIDWGYPDGSDRFLTLDDYILRFLGGCVDYLRKTHGLDAIDLLGICQGGTFSLCYASQNPGKIRRLITMVTPVDFHTPDNMLSHWTRDLDIDLFVDTLGNVPADLMNWCYLTLKPWRLFVQKYVGMTDILDNPAEINNFMRMEKWIFDSPDQAGEAFRQFIKQFYQGNGFIKGGIVVGGKEVSLKNITMPVLNIFAEQDHLVPPDASRPLGKLIGTKDYTELSFRGGHIGIYVSGRAQKDVPETIAQWLNKPVKAKKAARKA